MVMMTMMASEGVSSRLCRPHCVPPGIGAIVRHQAVCGTSNVPRPPHTSPALGDAGGRTGSGAKLGERGRGGPREDPPDTDFEINHFTLDFITISPHQSQESFISHPNLPDNN